VAHLAAGHGVNGTERAGDGQFGDRSRHGDLPDGRDMRGRMMRLDVWPRVAEGADRLHLVNETAGPQYVHDPHEALGDLGSRCPAARRRHHVGEGSRVVDKARSRRPDGTRDAWGAPLQWQQAG
jgi:hypothetical protein